MVVTNEMIEAAVETLDALDAGFSWLVHEEQVDLMRRTLTAALAVAPGVNEEALDIAAREGYAVRCKTNGPRFLAQYASDEVMHLQLEEARVIVTAYLAALETNGHD